MVCIDCRHSCRCCCPYCGSHCAIMTSWPLPHSRSCSCCPRSSPPCLRKEFGNFFGCLFSPRFALVVAQLQLFDQGASRGHILPQIFSICSDFVIWEAKSQTKCCCSPKVKHFGWPPPISPPQFWAGYAINYASVCTAFPPQNFTVAEFERRLCDRQTTFNHNYVEFCCWLRASQ